MLTVQKLLFLRRIDLFASLPANEVGRVAAITHEVVYPAGSVIIREGDYGDALFLIADGEVLIHAGDEKIKTLGPSEYFGEFALLAGEPRSASATALKDCLVLRINQSDFHDFLAANFDAVLAIVRTLCQRLQR